MTFDHRLGTRGSALAKTQSGHVADALAALGITCTLTVVRTLGDVTGGPLAALGGAGAFTAELREAVRDHRCDLAVHSLKDLPTADAPGLTLAAVPERAAPWDVLIAADHRRLTDLPAGARIGTGSPRRAAQLADLRPDLQIVDIRGNIDTRINRAIGPDRDLDAVVLAQAGLARLGRLDVVTDVLDLVPAPGQGALAVEIRTTDLDAPLGRAVAALDHLPSRWAVTAERALLARLEAGCSAPVGAHAVPVADGLELTAVLGTPDGLVRRTARQRVTITDDAHDLGVAVADDLLTQMR